ncbi:beta-phosphoglucomutase [Sediminitomix flava]|uniref:Beta-phosphoglucomutase n=1 Tax=Sediminitomix flava TaxID=379075 RepID=A0A315Z8F9_SEDFL|nr:beta-phosphoglucomutase [Sediminitomix flava]PWJ40845.1 beta-phosphoglucomutase [Sediminitomix flava]
MSTIKACLFDLDGVIVDTAKYHFLAWKRLADELGINFTEDDNEKLKGVSRVRSLEIILELGGKTLSEEDFNSFMTKKNDWYLEYVDQMKEDEILPGVLDFLKALKAEGVKVALGSASKNAMRILNLLNITDYFDAIIDGTSVSAAKPDPEVFLKGAEATGTTPAECVVFEDAEAGVEAAINGGMRVVGIGEEEALGKANIVVPGFANFSVEDLKKALA